MTEALGRSQVLEYLIDLSLNNKIYLLSFERSRGLENTENIMFLTKKHNIEWHYFDYSNHYGIFSTISQVIKAVCFSSAWVRQYKIQIVHARSMIPATMGLLLKKMHGVKLLFDIRGFAIDEKVDSGRLRKGSFLFTTLKKLDDYLYLDSDHIVTLTESARQVLQANLSISSEKITVITTCANNKIFKLMPEMEQQAFREVLGFGITDKIVVHTGTVSNRYDFIAEVRLFKSMVSLESNCKFLIVSKGDHEFIRNTLLEGGVENDEFLITSSSFEKVYQYLNIADMALFFIPPSYAKQAMAPTKFAENVACFLPSVTNVGVGDMAYYLQQYDVGYGVDLCSLQDNPEEIAKQVLKKISHIGFIQNEFNTLFDEHFDKKIATINYQKIYDNLSVN